METKHPQIERLTDFPDSVNINDGAIVYNNTLLNENVSIGEFSIIGKVDLQKQLASSKVTIGPNVQIGSYCTIYEDVTIDKNCFLDDYTHIGISTTIGEQCKLLYGAKIYKNVSIGNNCIVSGFCCSRSIIKDNSSVFGMLVHRYPNPIWGTKEKSPIIGNNVVVGMNAIIIGGITIGDNSFISAGAIVRKDVPEGTIVLNKSIDYVPLSNWDGRMTKGQ